MNHPRANRHRPAGPPVRLGVPAPRHPSDGPAQGLRRTAPAACAESIMTDAEKVLTYPAGGSSEWRTTAPS